MSIYEKLNIRRVINASGNNSRLGGCLLDERVLDAMREASTCYVDMEELKIEFDNGNVRSETMQWRDNWRFALGTEYKLNDKWTLRGGLAFDQTPVRSKDKRVAKLPDTNRVWASLGAGYQVSEKMRLDIAYTHLFFHRCNIEQSSASGTLEGYYAGGMHLVSMALNYKF